MRPFLKWLGNKYRSLNEIRLHLSPKKRLIEPFAGSGAVFLNTDYDSYLIAEQNQDLITLYKTLAQEGDKFINYTQKLFVKENNCEKTYYQLREKFNTTSNPRLKSALFLYLNRHGYNGLCRYNSQGGFNVPFGRYSKPYFPQAEMKYFIEKATKADFRCMDFKKTLAEASTDDIVYCDPPYIPLSASADFTAYTKLGFNETDQRELANMAEQLANKNIGVIISNHDTELARELYINAEIHSFSVSRVVGASANSRKPVQELLAIYR